MSRQFREGGTLPSIISALESQHFDRKSLRKVTGPTADFGELARDCVCFANGAGGTLLIGIEDDSDAPQVSQRIDPALLDRIRKRVGGLTVNVQVVPELKRHENGGDYIAITASRIRRRGTSCGGLDRRSPTGPSGGRSMTSSSPATC